VLGAARKKRVLGWAGGLAVVCCWEKSICCWFSSLRLLLLLLSYVSTVRALNIDDATHPLSCWEKIQDSNGLFAFESKEKSILAAAPAVLCEHSSCTQY
jgi:hypothetical protein